MVAADEVRRALATGAFVPYFQSIVALVTGRPVGYEALARWRHPSRGLLRPGTFLPALEAAGLVVPFGWHILAVVCAQIAA
jgi:EAL domain-containing protein (putative c-di-GMP-specific phosphodiesterase class I)